MNSDRLKQLLVFHNQDPNDPFIIYGIALEYMNSNLEMACNYFELLLEKHVEYLPTYYQAGHLYEEINEEDKAKRCYRKGIELAKTQNNTNTLRELQNALDELEFS